MTLSINTNTAALAALQSLSQTSAALTQTENQVATGKSVNSASDNPAVYSIAQTMNSQIGALTGVQSGLSFAAQVVNTSSTAAASITGMLSSLSQSIISAQTTGYDASTMNAALSQAMSQIDSAAAGATFQGVNLVAGATGRGVNFTSVSTAMDVNGSLYTQAGFNATSAGLGLSGLNVNQAGVTVDLGTSASGTVNTLDSTLQDGNSITLSNTAWGKSASASATTDGTATNPAIQFQFVAAAYSNGKLPSIAAATTTYTPTLAAGDITTAQTDLTSAFGSALGDGTVNVSSTGAVTITAGTASGTIGAGTTSGNTTTYAVKNSTGVAAGTLTATASASGISYSYAGSAVYTGGTSTPTSVTGTPAIAGTTQLTSALSNVLGTDKIVIGSDGTLSATDAAGTGAATASVKLSAKNSDGSSVYTVSNAAGTTSDTVTVAQDQSGNYTFSVASKFDANGNAVALNNIVVADTSAGTNAAGEDMMTAMTNAGFGVSQSATGVLTIAGNNLDAADSATSVATDLGATATPVTATVTKSSGSATALLAVQAAITKMNSISNKLGSAANQVSQLSTSTSSLSNALTTGVGALTDADLAAESAKLTSLQTKQQLAIQSLSIANSQSSSILSLFRG